MKARALAVIGALSVLLGAAVPAVAGAKTVKCRAGAYMLVNNDNHTEVSQLRAIGLPAKTSGYAPPCLVADEVAGLIQQRHGRTRRVHAYGARWDGGWWTVSHRVDSLAYDRYTARKGSQRVTFVFGL